jgi:glyoxylase-like metal-dependent hydrolase (beta-lactamase superfamily II)
VHVFVRDWLSSNNIVLKSAKGHVLVDTGYVQHAGLTLALLSTSRGVGDAPLAKVVNTHCHSDHMGGNAAVATRYGCPIAVPEGEASLIRNWDQEALLLEYADQHAQRFAVDEELRAGERYVWGDLEWHALAAPGHDMSALVFYNPEHGILISGDALWQNGFGFVVPPAFDPSALPATRATLEMLSALDVRIVIPGHGEPFTDVAAAIDRSLQRVSAFEANPVRMARHALKVFLMFHLLERQRLTLADLPAYLDRVGIYREYNAAFLRLPARSLVELLVNELQRSGAVRRIDGDLVPA